MDYGLDYSSSSDLLDTDDLFSGTDSTWLLLEMLGFSSNASSFSLLGDDEFYHYSMNDSSSSYDLMLPHAPGLLPSLGAGQDARSKLLADVKENFVTYKKASSQVIISLYVIIFLTSLAGNSLLILLISRRKSLRTVTNTFLINLAVADMLVTLVCMPEAVSHAISKIWMFGEIMCKTTAFLQGTAVCSSVLTLMFMSLERVIMIRFVMRCHFFNKLFRSKKGMFLLVLFIWLISGLLASPMLMVRHVQEYYLPLMSQNEALHFCYENWESTFDMRLYAAVLMACLCVVPTVIISTSYILVSIQLNTRNHVLLRQKVEKASVSTNGAPRDNEKSASSSNLRRPLESYRNSTKPTWNSNKSIGNLTKSTEKSTKSTEKSTKSTGNSTKSTGNTSDTYIEMEVFRVSPQDGSEQSKIPMENETCTLSHEQNHYKPSPLPPLHLPSHQPHLPTPVSIQPHLPTPVSIQPHLSTPVSIQPDQPDQPSPLSHQSHVSSESLSPKSHLPSLPLAKESVEQHLDLPSPIRQPLSPRLGPSHQPSANILDYEAMLASRRRLARLLIIISIVFGVCWLPYNTLVFLMDFSQDKSQVDKMITYTPFLLFLGHANSAINPVLYAFINTQFRDMVRNLFVKRINKQHTDNLSLTMPKRNENQRKQQESPRDGWTTPLNLPKIKSSPTSLIEESESTDALLEHTKNEQQHHRKQ